MFIRTLAAAAAAVAIAGSAARADEILDALALAREYYGEGDIGAATEELRFALEALQEKLAQELAATFPEPPEGWQAKPPEVRAGAGGIAGGIQISREYRQGAGNGRVVAQLMVDNPIVQGLAAMLVNPQVLLAQPGARRIRLGGRRSAVLVFDETTGEGRVQLLAGRALVQLEGYGLQDAGIVERLLKSWDLERIRKLVPAG